MNEGTKKHLWLALKNLEDARRSLSLANADLDDCLIGTDEPENRTFRLSVMALQAAMTLLFNLSENLRFWYK